MKKYCSQKINVIITYWRSLSQLYIVWEKKIESKIIKKIFVIYNLLQWKLEYIYWRISSIHRDKFDSKIRVERSKSRKVHIECSKFFENSSILLIEWYQRFRLEITTSSICDSFIDDRIHEFQTRNFVDNWISRFEFVFIARFDQRFFYYDV